MGWCNRDDRAKKNKQKKKQKKKNKKNDTHQQNTYGIMAGGESCSALARDGVRDVFERVVGKTLVSWGSRALIWGCGTNGRVRQEQ